MLLVSTAENCSGYRTCSQCLDQPGCGWCTDPSNTGRGQCLEGSYRGPIQTLLHAPSTSRPSLVPAPQAMLNVSWCPHENKYNWSFIQCPGIDISSHTQLWELWQFSFILNLVRICQLSHCASFFLFTVCQCNGHSACVNESTCERCEDLTTGKHCESCISGYYGDPTNGGSCQRKWLKADGFKLSGGCLQNKLQTVSLYVSFAACKCNGHASMCNSNNGKCFCTTKGIKGDRCHQWVTCTTKNPPELTLHKFLQYSIVA